MSDYGEDAYRDYVDVGHEERIMRRLKRAIRAAGGAKIVADLADVPYGTLSKNLSGDTKISFETVFKVVEALGLNLSDLMTKEDSSLDEPLKRTNSDLGIAIRKNRNVHAQVTDVSSGPVGLLDDWTMRRIAVVVTAVHGERRHAISPENVAVETALLYNELVRRVTDITDREEIEAALPQLRHLLVKRLEQAQAKPGAGKASA